MKMRLGLFAALLFLLSIPLQAACTKPNNPEFDPQTIEISGASLSYSKTEGPSWITTIGTLKNTSPFKLEDILVEVKYFDAEGKLVDVLTESLYEVTLQPSQEISFRVRGVADKAEKNYVSTTVRVVSAYTTTPPKNTENDNSFHWLNYLLTWAPMLLFIIVWCLYIWYVSNKKSPQWRTISLLEQQQTLYAEQLKLIERIAISTEKMVSDKVRD